LQGPSGLPRTLHDLGVNPTLKHSFTAIPREHVTTFAFDRMFKRSFGPKDGVIKNKKPSKRSFRDDAKQKLREQLNAPSSPPLAG